MTGIDRLNTEALNPALLECRKAFERTGAVPYVQRVRLDEASRTVHGPDGVSSLGRFPFLFGVRLACLCAERSLPLWTEKVPGNALAGFAALVEEGLHGRAGFDRISAFSEAMDAEIMERIYGWEEADIDTAGAAGFSCVTALRVFLGQFSYWPGAETEQEADTHHWDSAFHTAVALSGGAPWQSEEKALDPAARHAFWRWYLDEAIPGAVDYASSRAWNVSNGQAHSRP